MEALPPGRGMPPEMQAMDMTRYMQTNPQSFMFPGVSAMANTPLPLLDIHPEVSAPEIPTEINVEKRLLWFYEIKELVSNWKSIPEVIQQCVAWIREAL